MKKSRLKFIKNSSFIEVEVMFVVRISLTSAYTVTCQVAEYIHILLERPVVEVETFKEYAMTVIPCWTACGVSVLLVLICFHQLQLLVGMFVKIWFSCVLCLCH